MGDWIVGALINLVGSIAINFGTNLLKLGHDQRERFSLLSGDGSSRLVSKSIMHFHSWRLGILFFVFGNCLNFISFGYAAQSLLAALGSVQFVSNIAFSYFVLSKIVTVKVMVATVFVILGNIFLVCFGNHQSPVFTPEQLAEKYKNFVFLLYCFILLLVVAANQYIYRKGEISAILYGSEISPCWHTLLPFSYAIVSGAIGSCSVLFAKSLSNMLRLTMSSNHNLHNWFTYSMFLLFLSTAGFWMTRLNEGLSLFDAILIVPMFQISWTFFSICTGFIYFQEYQVLDALRSCMFVLGMLSVFIGISLLAPEDSKGDGRDASLSPRFSQGAMSDLSRMGKEREDDSESKYSRLLWWALMAKVNSFIENAKTACTLSLGLGEESMHSSSVLVMPMISSSRETTLRGSPSSSRARFGPADWPASFPMMDDIIHHNHPASESTSLLID